MFSLLLTSKVRDYLLHPQFNGKVGYTPKHLMTQKYCEFGLTFIAKKYEFQWDDLPKFGKVEGFLRKNIKSMRTRIFLYRITQTLTIVDHMYSDDGKIIGYYVFCNDSNFIMNLLRLSKIFEKKHYGELKFDLDDLSRIPIYFSLDPERHRKVLNDRLQDFSKEDYRRLIHSVLEDTKKNIGHRQKFDLIFRPMLNQGRIQLYFTNKN